MEKFNRNILDTIGHTPIIRLKETVKGVDSEIYVKLEFMNPGGSIKDRIGMHILKKAMEAGDLKAGGTVVEGTSGNTGVGLAMFCALHKLKCIFVLADKQSQEKISNLRAFGAKVIVCPTNVDPEDPRSYYSVSKRLAETIPNSYYVNQYHNLWNQECHYQTTGPEIWEQTGGEFDVFMAGVGTGGTISGTGKYLKEQKPELQVVGVDIRGSILAHYHKTGEMCEAHPYVLEGIGEDIIPENVNFKVIDDFVMVEDKESFLMTRSLLIKEGVYTGGSGGAAVVAALRYARGLKSPKKILVILPDSGNRYASKIFNDDWMRENGYSDSSFNVMVREVLENSRRKSPGHQVFSVDDGATVSQAIKVMNTNGVSQIPVYSREGQVIGMVAENELLRPLYEGKISAQDSISVALNTHFVTVDLNEMLSDVTDSLLEKKIVLVMDKGKVVDVLTDIDILEFIRKQRSFV